MKLFIGDFFDRIYGLNGTVPKTAIGMFKNPGHVIQEYLSGVRRKYVGPVGYYFLMYAAFLIMFPLLGIEMNDYMPKQETFNTPIEQVTGQEIDSEAVQSQYEFRQKLFDNLQFFIIFWFPFIAIWVKIIFRSSNYNFLENMVFAFFVNAQSTIFNMVALLCYAISGVKLIGLVMIISIGYFAWAGSTHFMGKSKFKIAIKSLLVWILSYLTFFASLMVAVFVISMVLSFFGLISV